MVYNNIISIIIYNIYILYIIIVYKRTSTCGNMGKWKFANLQFAIMQEMIYSEESFLLIYDGHKAFAFSLLHVSFVDHE